MQCKVKLLESEVPPCNLRGWGASHEEEVSVVGMKVEVAHLEEIVDTCDCIKRSECFLFIDFPTCLNIRKRERNKVQRFPDVASDLIYEGSNTHGAGVGFDVKFERLVWMV